MKYVLSAQEAKELDMSTITTVGIPSLVLMERAALSVVESIEELAKEQKKKQTTILCVCGVGNNGGDGVAVARILCQKGYQVSCKMVGNQDRCSMDNRQQQEIARNVGVSFVEEESQEQYDIIVDALFGIGLSRMISGQYEKEIQRINESDATVVAVDIPSGIHTDTGQIMGCAVKADITVTFGYAKLGHLLYPGAEYAGRLVITDIGFQPMEANWQHFYYEQEDLQQLLPVRKAYSNKGTYGKVLVVAGSVGMAGAAYLSAKAAYKMGAGLVKIVTAQENREILQCLLPEAVLLLYDGKHLEEQTKQIRQEIERATVIVVGPGIGLDSCSKDLVKLVLQHAKVPTVVDADALTLLAGMPEYVERTAKGKCRIALSEQFILTPHLKEMTTLLGNQISVGELAGQEADLPKICSNNGCTIVLKDARTKIMKENMCGINRSGNSGMATAGSGDVLTGIIAGLLAQGCPAYIAASLGAYIHGCAGDEAAKQKGQYALMAQDLIDSIETVIR